MHADASKCDRSDKIPLKKQSVVVLLPISNFRKYLRDLIYQETILNVPSTQREPVTPLGVTLSWKLGIRASPPNCLNSNHPIPAVIDRENISGQCTCLAAGKRTARRKNKEVKNRREWEGGRLIGSSKNTSSFLENVNKKTSCPEPWASMGSLILKVVW